jgi:pSer/pThr/pTyr-binding forkhead associated (FHA) protein/exonuclease VII small subunit
VGSRFTIGRDATNAIVLTSPFVSKAHAQLEYLDGRYVIEDLKSVNGTKVNGAPVQVYAVTPGDVIEIGDLRLAFVDRAAKAPTRPARSTGRAKNRTPAQADGVASASGRGKTLRLAAVALATLVVTGGVMTMIVRSGRESPSTPVAETVPRPTKPRDVTGPMTPNPEAIRAVEAAAARAGVRVTDALYDEGLAQLKGGRYRQAAQLFAAVLERDRTNQSARARLEDMLVEIERAIEDHLARADRAFGELRYDDAIVEWQKVTELTSHGDPRLAAAHAGIKRALQARQSR